jgi:hypothetical protein
MPTSSWAQGRWPRRAGKAVRYLRAVRFRAVVRFSVFDPAGSWRAAQDAFTGPDDYRDHLWSTERLEPRLRVFGRYAAPIYQRMARDHDFRVLVLHSPELPEPWAGALRDLADRYPVLDLVPVPGMVDLREPVRLSLLGSGRSGTVVMLRVDDDDVLAQDFLDQLAPYATPVHEKWCISLSRGVAARLTPDGPTDFRRHQVPFSSIGQAFVGTYRARGGVLSMPQASPHTRVATRRPTIVDARTASWLQVRHPLQDTRLPHDPEDAERRIVRQLSRMEPVRDHALLLRKFPTLTAVAASDPTEGI